MGKKNTGFVSFMLSFVESYLTEYCKVREIEEKSLEDYLRVVFFPAHTMLVTTKNGGKVEFGVTFTLGDESSLEFFGNFCKETSRFPLTTHKITENNLQILNK